MPSGLSKPQWSRTYNLVNAGVKFVSGCHEQSAAMLVLPEPAAPKLACTGTARPRSQSREGMHGRLRR